MLASEPIRPVVQAGGRAVVKRVFDLLISGAVVLLFLPLWVLVSVLIKLDSRGPVFFVQEAIGLNGAHFRLLKFRSMRVGSQDEAHFQDVRSNLLTGQPTTHDAEGRPIYKTALRDSSRITRVGRVLRRLSLDEIPQLWNVICGEMSLVGPRPSLTHEAALYCEWQKHRFAVRPGITGLYQVTARNRVSIQDMIRIDLDYIRRQSLLLDIWIIVRTPAAMLRGI